MQNVKLTEREQQLEKEANLFALAILMPKDQFVKDLDNLELTDDTELKKLAVKYSVTMTMIAARIKMLTDMKVI